MARTIRRFDDNDQFDSDRYEAAISRFLENSTDDTTKTVFVPMPEERRRTRRFAKEAQRKARVAA